MDMFVRSCVPSSERPVWLLYVVSVEVIYMSQGKLSPRPACVCACLRVFVSSSDLGPREQRGSAW